MITDASDALLALGLVLFPVVALMGMTLISQGELGRRYSVAVFYGFQLAAIGAFTWLLTKYGWGASRQAFAGLGGYSVIGWAARVVSITILVSPIITIIFSFRLWRLRQQSKAGASPVAEFARR